MPDPLENSISLALNFDDIPKFQIYLCNCYINLVYDPFEIQICSLYIKVFSHFELIHLRMLNDCVQTFGSVSV